MVFNLRKRNKMAKMPDNHLLTDPHDWMQEVCGSLDLINRSDSRIGVDRYVGADDTIIINGVGRSETFDPILAHIESLDNGAPAGFGSYHLTSTDLLKLLTPDMQRNWQKLPERWCSQDAIELGMSKSNVSKLKKRAISLGILEIDLSDPKYLFKSNGFAAAVSVDVADFVVEVTV